MKKSFSKKVVTLLSGILAGVLAAAVFFSGCGAIPELQFPASHTAAPSETPSTLQPPVMTPGETLPPPSILPVTPESPLPVYTPLVTPFRPSAEQAELFEYVLELINLDRRSVGLNPVVLSYNAAAQIHAQDMFDNFFISHWGTDGLKPYMRYTRWGGLNYEQENSAYSGWYDPSADPENYVSLDVRQELKHLQWAMMYDDAASGWGHRDNILNPWHKKVNLGIAYDDKRLALVQQFEGDYVEYIRPPQISGGILTLSGKFRLGTLNNVLITYDEYPEPLTPAELIAGPHSYSLGQRLGYIVPPPPPGQYYVNLPGNAIQASRWEEKAPGQYDIQADISQILNKGRGVYTISAIAVVEGQPRSFTNYSIFMD